MSSPSAGNQPPDAGEPLQDEITALRASRRRIAGDAHADRRSFERRLHDGVQQQLTALAVDLQRLVRLAADDAAGTNGLVLEMTAILREALDETAALATLIYPQIHGGRGLAGALRSAASGAGITAVVDVPAVAGDSPEITAALYWAWTDMLSSAAAGSEATIRVLAADAGLAFEISVAGPRSDAHLERLRDRIEALNGRVSIQDGPDGGARVQGWVPLPG